MRELGVEVERNFMDTSPSNGVLSFEPYVKFSNFSTQDPNFGDSHYYYLTLDCEDDSTHRQFRFLSESGFQSEASMVDYENVGTPSDWAIDSKFLKLRTTFNQPHQVMVNQTLRHYELPRNASDPFDRSAFEYYLWLSQIQQGRCMQTVFEKQRRGKSVSNIKNMGSIYWQFNTDWQAPSWSALDYSGNWKVSQYFT
mmetsp:Transcript_16175/g.27372  ORF Transcript_16175/g.27372 Transcript_16175/m.27372 type:complete len:197 (-) Transcript_16175:720-1310(-)